MASTKFGLRTAAGFSDLLPASWATSTEEELLGIVAATARLACGVSRSVGAAVWPIVALVQEPVNGDQVLIGGLIELLDNHVANRMAFGRKNPAHHPNRGRLADPEKAFAHCNRPILARGPAGHPPKQMADAPG